MKEIHKKRGVGVEVAIFVFSLALLLFVGLFLVVNKKVTQDMQATTMWMRVLTDEIGEVKAENQQLLEYAKKNIIIGQPVKSIPGDEVQQQVLQQVPVVLPQRPQPVVKASIPVIEAIGAKSPKLPYQRIADFNVLLVGHHSKLTDTIMVASVNDQTQKVKLFSIPRDLSVNGRKVNEYYMRFGIEELSRHIESVIGLTIDRYAVVDMTAFVKVVDALGGVDVNVERAIYDNAYPTLSGGYQVYSISEGQHHLYGEEALKYARSRSSTSDFHRAARQQQVIQSLKQRVLAMEFLRNVDKAKEFYSSIISLVSTDIGFFEGLLLLQKYQNHEIEPGIVLSTENHLYATRNFGGQYILLPKGGSWSGVQGSIADLFVK